MEYGIPDEILTYHRTQFVAAKSSEKARHKFKEFLKWSKAYSCQNKPPTNKREIKFFGLMEQKLHLFDSVEEFVYWYNLSSLT